MPSDRTVTVLPDGRTRVGGDPWPREVRELAFELWYLKFHRNMSDVADYLNALPDQDRDHPADDLAAFNRDVVVEALQDRKISTKTLYGWSRVDDWAIEAENRHRQLAPALYQRVDHELEIASIEAVETLISLMRDKNVNPQVRQKAADSILDRSGHTAFVRPSDDGKITGPQRDYSGTVAGKSMEDLLKIALSSKNS